MAYMNDLRNDLVCLDNRKNGTFASDAKPLALADIAETGSADRCPFELYRIKYCHRRDRRSSTRPFHILQLCFRRLILPFEGISSPGRMMSGHGTGACINRVIIRDDQPVYRIRIGAIRDFLGPCMDAGIDRLEIRMINPLMIHGMESESLEECHAFSPGNNLMLGKDQRERNPADASALYFFDIFQRQRTAGQISWICIVLIALHAELLEVRIADHRLAADDQMPFFRDFRQNAMNRGRKMRDIRSDMTIAASHNLRQLPVIIGHDQGQAIQLPGQPDRSALCPFHEIFRFLGLGKGQRREFMRFFLPGNRVCTDPVRRGIREDFSGFLLQLLQLIEHGVPFIVRHLFSLAVVICICRRIQLINQLTHAQSLVFCFAHFSPLSCSFSSGKDVLPQSCELRPDMQTQSWQCHRSR